MIEARKRALKHCLGFYQTDNYIVKMIEARKRALKLKRIDGLAQSNLVEGLKPVRGHGNSYSKGKDIISSIEVEMIEARQRALKHISLSDNFITVLNGYDINP